MILLQKKKRTDDQGACFFQCWEQSELNYPAKMTRQLLGLKQPLQTKECKQVTGFQT